MKAHKPETEATPLDDAARAAWLYYIGGQTQDQIARELGISRQRAQRLVSKAVAEGLIHVRLEHPVSRALELEQKLTVRFGLKRCRVALGLGGDDPLRSVAPTAAAEIERILRSEKPLVLALGTGRTLRATIEELQPTECPQHRIVSLIGNIAPDGSASYFDCIMRIADKARAPHYPMPLPVIASSPQERDHFLSLKPIRRTRALARAADVTFVGIGQIGDDAPMKKDGFASEPEMRELRAVGAVGEIVGWAYDRAGNYPEVGTNLRVTSVRMEPAANRLTVGVAAGPEKVPALRTALEARLINAVVTDEATAKALLE